MANHQHETRDVLKEELRSSYSPAQSSYGGSDAGDDIAMNEGETTGQEVDDIEMESPTMDPHTNANDTQMENRAENALQTEGSDDEHSQLGEEENERENEANISLNSAVLSPVSQVLMASTTVEGPRYKYKYPEAYPTPPGWDDEVWNKAYTAADSRIYNHAKKNHQVSKQKRQEGVTREEALRWELERPEREARRGKKSQQQSRAGASSSAAIPSTSTFSNQADNMANKKPQKKTKKKPEVAPSTAPAQQSMTFSAPSPEFGSTQTLADRIKGKSAASAAASSASSGEPSIPLSFGAESEKASKRPNGSAKKQPNGKANLLPPPPPVVKPQATTKGTPLKPRGSKSGTPVNARDLLQPDEELELFSDDEADDDDNLYCVCRGPQSINMILCDTCQEWFHRRPTCIGEGDPGLYKNFAKILDQWYCPPCKEKDPSLQVTYYRSCRRPGCKNPALVEQDPPSKYCSEECGIKFFHEKFAEAPSTTEPSRGGALTQSEIALALNSVKSAAEFKQLGKTAPKLHGKGKVVSKQFLRNLANTISSDGNAEKIGKVYEDKADYEAKAADEVWERETAAKIARDCGQQHYEMFNPVYSGPTLTYNDIGEIIYEAIAGGSIITKENYLDVDFRTLRMHGLIDATEAETINDLQELMKFNQFHIQIAELKMLYTKAIIQKSTETLKAKSLAPKNTCGFLSKISIGDIPFQKWLTTDDGIKFSEWARSAEGAKFRDWCFSREGSKYQQGVDHDERLVVGSQIEKWGKDFAVGICEHVVKKHTTHFKWAEVHDRDNSRRKQQFTEEFNAKLKELNGVLMMIDQRVLQSDWKPIIAAKSPEAQLPRSD